MGKLKARGFAGGCVGGLLARLLAAESFSSASIPRFGGAYGTLATFPCLLSLLEVPWPWKFHTGMTSVGFPVGRLGKPIQMSRICPPGATPYDLLLLLTSIIIKKP